MIVKKHAKNIHEIQMDGKQVKIAMLSDLHWDNPKCDWKMKQTKEGFTSTIEVSPIQNMKNVVKDNVRKAKTMTESFFSR